ncbi:MAG: hypothetical protein HIU83_18210 [Proteobacteria bacterium]|nr:hypothetical protein [Pseudomonadota bacterium]
MINSIKNFIKQVPAIMRLYGLLSNKSKCAPGRFNSSTYWDSRYRNGGTSGAGSYNRLAEFKAEIINCFVDKNSIGSVIEFGFGDGNQLALANYPQYVGYDVSEKTVEICRVRFNSDTKKHFIIFRNGMARLQS